MYICVFVPEHRQNGMYLSVWNNQRNMYQPSYHNGECRRQSSSLPTGSCLIWLDWKVLRMNHHMGNLNDFQTIRNISVGRKGTFWDRNIKSSATEEQINKWLDNWFGEIEKQKLKYNDTKNKCWCIRWYKQQFLTTNYLCRP